MWTTVLPFLILFMGFITFAAGAFGALMLVFEEVSKTECVHFKYYAMVVGLISGGLGKIGIGQGLPTEQRAATAAAATCGWVHHEDRTQEPARLRAEAGSRHEGHLPRSWRRG